MLYNSMPDKGQCSLYQALQMRIRELFAWQHLPILYRFASNNLNVMPAKGLQPVNMGMCCKPYEYELSSRYSWVDSRLSDEMQNACMFSQITVGDVEWKKRNCGSTDKHLSRPETNTRSFTGEVLQINRIIADLCCGPESGLSLQEMRDEYFKNAMEALIDLIQERLIQAIFAPAYDSSAINGGIKTFLDDTNGREIDLSANPLTYQNVIQKLVSINNIRKPSETYFWFVPTSFYAVLVSLIISQDKCCNHQVMYKGQLLESGIQIDLFPNIKIVPIDDNYFPISNGKIVSAVIPEGAIAFTIRRPHTLMQNMGGATEVTEMVRQYLLQRTGNDYGQSKVLWFETYLDPSINFNMSFNAFVAVVAGRLKNNRMWRVLLNTSPSSSDAPDQVIDVQGNDIVMSSQQAAKR